MGLLTTGTQYRQEYDEPDADRKVCPYDNHASDLTAVVLVGYRGGQRVVYNERGDVKNIRAVNTRRQCPVFPAYTTEN